MLEHSSSKELVNGLHKEKEKLIHAKKVLKNLDGKKAPEKHGLLQKALHGTGKYAALYLGDKLGGPIGAVIGDMVGKNIIKAADRRYGKNIFEKPAVRKALEMLNSENPKVHASVERELKKYGVKATALKKALEHAKVMEQKRGEYQEKKKETLEGKQEEPSVYEPYTESGIIQVGKNPKKKVPANAIPYDTAPNVYGPNKKEIPLKKKRPELYEKYTEPGVIDFGNKGVPSKKKQVKSLPVIR